MKFGIAPKLVLLLTALVCLTGWVLVSHLSDGASAIVIAHERGDLSDEAKLRAHEFQQHLYAIRRGLEEIGRTAELQNYLSDRSDVAQQAVAEMLERKSPHNVRDWYLRLELWSGRPNDPASFRPLNLPDELQRVQPVEVPVQAVQEMAELPPLEPFLTDIENSTVQPRDSERDARRAHTVWCGLRLAAENGPPATPQDELYLLALIDLDAPLPNGKPSPLAAINSSPRHLAVLVNEPDTMDAAEGTDAASTAPRLVFLDESKEEYLDAAPLQQRFRELYRRRGELTELDQKVQSMLTATDARPGPQKRARATSEESVLLRQPLWFQQTEPVDDASLRAVLAEELRALQNSKSAELAGVRLGGLANGVLNIRMLASHRADLAQARQLLDAHLRSPAAAARLAGFELDWRQPVECRTCAMQYVLFPMRSAGGLRYYGLAYSAFLEEMSADVAQELRRVVGPALLMITAVALIGFLASLVFTRPLKRITLAAESFAGTRLDPDPDNRNWQRDIHKILDALPVRRRDEIGVLAGAFRKMVGEVLESHERLRALNAELDHRVNQRTEELERANSELLAARDKAQEVSRAKDAFLASVSHELRNPLNQVSGFCQLLEMTELDDDQRADLNKIKLAGAQLLALINDILDYQKIIMGGITLEPEEFPVAELLREVQEAMAFQATEHKVTLRVSWADDVGSVYADKRRLRQVLLNLVGNACKFAPQGEVNVHADRRAMTSGEGDEIVMSVVDTGRGMTAEEQAKLFRPFVKLAAKAGNRSGTGLGLVISKGFCELMGGDIQVSSEFGVGTRFTIHVPARTRSGLLAAAGQSDRRAAAPGARFHGAVNAREEDVRERPGSHTVLVIDDDPNVRELMSRYLGNQGFRVETAGNGVEGLQRCKELLPAVVTLDAVMPGVLDGWGVLAAMKSDEATADIPVVMVTMLENEQRGQAMGASDYLLKPVDWTRLSQVLQKYVPHPATGRILVVDDDPSAREMLCRQLQHDGWQTVEAEHGSAALELLQHDTPAAILLDLMMPVMDGFQFLHEFMRSEHLRRIPVIVVTAKDPTPEEYKRLGGLVARVLQKGQHTPEDLLTELHRRVDVPLATAPTPLGEGQDD